MKNLIKTFSIIPILFICFLIFPQHAAGLTFGYTTAGSSSIRISSEIWSSLFTGVAGTGVSMTAYLNIDPDTDRRFKYNIYLHSDLTLLANGKTAENPTATGGGLGWHTLDFVSAPTFTAVGYLLAAWAPSDADNSIYFDTGDTDQGHYTALTYAADWPDPHPTPTHSTRKFSIYATYTAGGASDTCTCTPGSDWYISANDNCFLSTSCDLGKEYSIHILNDKGPGSFNIIDNAVLSVHSINNTSTPVNVEAGSKINFK